MKCEYVGKQMMDYLNKDGKRIQGVNMHLLGKSRKVDGTAVSILYVSKSDPIYEDVLKLPYGKLDIDFDAGGIIQDITHLGDDNEE